MESGAVGNGARMYPFAGARPMPHTIVNLALTVVSEKIDQALLNYPRYPHQRIFQRSDLRQRLEAYVLSRMPSLYVAIDNSRACSLEYPSRCFPHSQLLQMEQLIGQGIEKFLAMEALDPPTSSGEVDVSLTPSSWFG